MEQKKRLTFIKESGSFSKVIRKRMRNGKKVCGALIAFFKELKELEEAYSQGLKKLLKSGNISASLNVAKQKEVSYMGSVIDSTLLGLLGISENHLKLAEFLKNETTAILSEVLLKFRETKRKLVKGTQTGIFRDYGRVYDKYKKQENEVDIIQNKLNQLKTGHLSEAQTFQVRLTESESSLQKILNEKNEILNSNKEKFTELMHEIENIEEFRLTCLRNINHAYLNKYMETCQNDMESIRNSMSIFNTIQIDPELQEIKAYVGETSSPKNVEQIPVIRANKIISPANILDKSLGISLIINSPSNDFILQERKRMISKFSPDMSKILARSLSINESYLPERDIVNKFVTPTENQHNGLQTGGNHMIQKQIPILHNEEYQDNDSQSEIFNPIPYSKFPRFTLISDIFPYKESMTDDIKDNFDEKQYKAVIFGIFSNFVMQKKDLLSMDEKIQRFPDDKTGSKESFLLNTIKNRLNLTFKDIKIIDKVLKLTEINKDKNIMELMISKIIELITSKSIYTLSFDEQSSYFLLLKHFNLLIKLNSVWKHETIKMLDKPQNAVEASKAKQDYCDLLNIFTTKFNENDSQDLFESISNNIKLEISSKNEIILNYPINTSIIEALLRGIFERNEDESRIFIDYWENFFEIFVEFGKEILHLDSETIYLILFKEIFEKYIKKYASSKNTKLEDLANDISSFLLKYPFMIKENNMKNNNQLMILAFDREVTQELKCILTKDIWIQCIRMVEAMKKSLPYSKPLIQIIMTFAHISYNYHKDCLKIKGFVENIAKACKMYGFHLHTSIKKHIINKEIPKKESAISKDEYSILLRIFQILRAELESNLKNLIELIIISISQILKMEKKEVENHIKTSFLEGLIDETIKQMKLVLIMEEKNGFENDLTTIINEIATIDLILSQSGFYKINLSENCLIYMDKWFINFKNKVIETTLKLENEEKWKKPSDPGVLYTHTPLDICYVLFNSVKFINTLTNTKFKELCLHKFEDIIFDCFTKYMKFMFDELNKSESIKLQGIALKALSLPLTKMYLMISSTVLEKNTVRNIWLKQIAYIAFYCLLNYIPTLVMSYSLGFFTMLLDNPILGKLFPIKQEDLMIFEQKETLEAINGDVCSLCLRLGNLHFLESQIKTVANDLFESKSLIMEKLTQEISTYFKKLSKAISLILMNKYIFKMIFHYLYINIDEDEISKLSSAEFQNQYYFSCKNLLMTLVPIIKKINQKTYKDYFPKFIVELASIFLTEYSVNIVDQDKIPRTSQHKFGEFLILEIKTINDFFFPPELGIAYNDEYVQRVKVVESIIMYFMGDSSTLIQEYQKLDISHQKERFLSRVLSRILASRINDPAATKFCTINKNFLSQNLQLYIR